MLITPQRSFISSIQSHVQDQWQRRGWLAWSLWPISLLFRLLTTLRRFSYRKGWQASWRAPVPLVLVGNVTVGGSGKTPLVMALAQALHAAGWTPGILSRGYGAHIPIPRAVDLQACATEVGDEPLLMASTLASLSIPVWVHPNRPACARALLAQHPECNILICDDGLQHYPLARQAAYAGGQDVEIVVFDRRMGGNGFLLPAGPLREPMSRPRDITLINDPEQSSQPEARQWVTRLVNGPAWQLSDPQQRRPLQNFTGLQIVAAAGIGHPQRFFDTLIRQGLRLQTTLALPDHYDFHQNPFTDLACDILLITEKDAVKCHHHPQLGRDPRIWVVPAYAELPSSLIDHLLGLLPASPKGIRRGSATT